MPALSPFLEPYNLIITIRKQYIARTHTIDAIIKDHMQASELTTAAQLNSRGSHGAAPQVEDGNGSDGGVGCARCQ